MLDLYKSFFGQYCRFLSKDIVVALDKNVGRNTKVINTFFDIFFIINKKDAKKESKTKAINLLKIQIDEYLKEGNTKLYSQVDRNLGCDIMNTITSLGGLQNLQTPLNEFNEAFALYKKAFPDLIFKQSMIEFNNALSHLFIGFTTSPTAFEKNIDKATTHLHRGTLDFYKTIIKDKGFDENGIDELVKIRVDELRTIGLKTTTDDKDDIVQRYRAIAKKAMAS